MEFFWDLPFKLLKLYVKKGGGSWVYVIIIFGRYSEHTLGSLHKYTSLYDGGVCLR